MLGLLAAVTLGGFEVARSVEVKPRDSQAIPNRNMDSPFLERIIAFRQLPRALSGLNLGVAVRAVADGSKDGEWNVALFLAGFIEVENRLIKTAVATMGSGVVRHKWHTEGGCGINLTPHMIHSVVGHTGALLHVNVEPKVQGDALTDVFGRHLHSEPYIGRKIFKSYDLNIQGDPWSLSDFGEFVLPLHRPCCGRGFIQRSRGQSNLSGLQPGQNNRVGRNGDGGNGDHEAVMQINKFTQLDQKKKWEAIRGAFLVLWICALAYLVCRKRPPTGREDQNSDNSND